MKLHHRYLPLVLVGFVSACGGAAAGTPAVGPAAATADAPAAAPLDGRSYEVTLDIPGSGPVKDTLRFERGRFESKACTALGFPEWSDYAARTEREAVAFHVLAKHPAGTTMDWNGSVQEGAVEGTADRIMNGKIDHIRFKGSLRP
ncbi:MAG: hypothetical protein JOZ69_08755 [Myxococcales bacterium]|nr:hypothetical protein [Myxococcales bacterium]